MAKIQVVVVGGGSAGTNCARTLSTLLDSDKHAITLINDRKWRIWYPATLRLVVSDRHDLGMGPMAVYDKVFVKNNGVFVHNTVSSVSFPPSNGDGRGNVVLADGKIIAYDYLVLAPGSTWQTPLRFPLGEDEIVAFIAEQRERFEAAKDIVIAGGGAVGAELTGEIKDIWPNKNVTLVHKEPRLLNEAYPTSFRDTVTAAVRSRGVELLLGDVIEQEDVGDEGVVITKGGKEVTCDLLVPTVGPKPHTAFLADTGLLDARGYIEVNETLETKAQPKIFAAGDAIAWGNVQRQAAKSSAQGVLVAKNIHKLISANGPLLAYKAGAENLVLTNGKKGGISYFGALWGLSLGGWVTSLLKSKGLLIWLFRKESGL